MLTSKRKGTKTYVIGLFLLIVTVSLTLLSINHDNKKIQSSGMCAEHFVSLDEITDRAELIVIGEVISSTPELRVDMVHTVQDIKVSKYIKKDDEVNDIIKVLQIGGEMEGHISPAFPEAPLFETGEKYLLFLRKVTDGKDYYLVLGGYQGSAKISKFGKLKVIIDDDEVHSKLKDKSVDEIEKTVVEHLEKK